MNPGKAKHTARPTAQMAKNTKEALEAWGHIWRSYGDNLSYYINQWD